MTYQAVQIFIKRSEKKKETLPKLKLQPVLDRWQQWAKVEESKPPPLEDEVKTLPSC